MQLDGMTIWRRGTYTLQDLIGKEDVNNGILNLASQIPSAVAYGKGLSLDL